MHRQMTPSPVSTTPLDGTLASRRTPLVLRGLAGVDVPSDVVDTGAGRPVVFLHGLVGLNEHWEDVARKIVHRCRCVMLQLPLLDLTGDDCSIDGATELTVRFVRQHLGERAVVIGNSFGGHVALRMALDHPDLLRGLILAGASGLIEKSMVSDIQIRPSHEWLTRKIGELFHDKSKMNPADVDRAHAELSDRAHARAMVKLSRSARRNHLGDRINRIACPTLLIWGRQDIVTPPEAAYELKEKIADSRLVWLDECGHAPMIEKPDAFAEAIHDFLDELDRRG
jgi:pimeloyl-ACP methyl ester carboxylesterase